MLVNVAFDQRITPRFRIGDKAGDLGLIPLKIGRMRDLAEMPSLQLRAGVAEKLSPG